MAGHYRTWVPYLIHTFPIINRQVGAEGNADSFVRWGKKRKLPKFNPIAIHKGSRFHCASICQKGIFHFLNLSSLAASVFLNTEPEVRNNLPVFFCLLSSTCASVTTVQIL